MSSPGLSGRSSIPATPAIEPRSRGVLDHPHSRVMTTEYDSAFSRHEMPEVCFGFALFQTEGAGKTGCALHPRSRVQYVHKNAHTSIQVQRRASGLPCAMVLRLITRSPRRPAFLPPSLADRSTSLTPASGRQDHTPSPSASAALVSRSIYVHRIPPRVS